MDLSFLDDLNVKIAKNTPLSRWTTFKLGGMCPAVIKCGEEKVLLQVALRLRARNIPFLMIGFGSNILASDQGIDTIIVRYMSPVPIVEQKGNILRVGAASLLDRFCHYTVEQGIEGFTSLIGIPGTVAGAIAGNAGAYGEQISDHLISVTVLRPEGTVLTLTKEKLNFHYRDSDLKHNGDIILSAEFDLIRTKDTAALLAKRDELLKKRKLKPSFWQETPCAGSFFRNIKQSANAKRGSGDSRRKAAGWFLEEAGAKKLNINGAHTYEEHANIVTYDADATAEDVYKLTMQMAKLVKDKFGIILKREVRLLGRFKYARRFNPNGFW